MFKDSERTSSTGNHKDLTKHCLNRLRDIDVYIILRCISFCPFRSLSLALSSSHRDLRNIPRDIFASQMTIIILIFSCAYSDFLHDCR